MVSTPRVSRARRAASAVAPAATEDRRWACYLLRSAGGRLTYVGSSVDVARRLRQHNGERSGGARYTHRDRPWTRLAVVRGFREAREALCFEWRWKRATRTAAIPRTAAVPRTAAAAAAVDTAAVAATTAAATVPAAVLRRLRGLAATLAMDRWTRNAPPARDVPLSVTFEDPAVAAAWTLYGIALR